MIGLQNVMDHAFGEWLAIRNHWQAVNASEDDIKPPSVDEFERWQAGAATRH